MAAVLCFSSFPKKILLGSIICVSTKHIEESEREYLFEKVTLLKDKIDQAYDLILDERKVLLADDVSLQDQVHMLTRLCYDTEDMVVRFKFKIISLKSLAWSRLEKSIEVYNLERQLLSMATRLGNAISSLQRRLTLNPLQTPSSLGHYKRFLSHQRKREDYYDRYEDKSAIIEKLVSGDGIKSSGVSIVGINGVGKTALVQEILSDGDIIDSYDLRLCSSLSGPFNSEEISKQLLESYKESEYLESQKRENYGAHCNYTSMYQSLHDSRWLIVLDNLSDVTCTEWSDFRSLYHSSRKGMFLITTVNYNIPVVTQTTRHCLHPLSNENCSRVIFSKAKREINVLSPEIDILAKKCSGLPLVANFMGYQLHDEDKRRTMLDRNLWEVPGFQREILPTLASLYSILKPRHLRKCFAYFSLFPHDYDFNMEDLIHLWIGEGFIQCGEESSLVQVGKDYFETLVKWSILQHSAPNCKDEKDVYKIHEFIHKLAKLVASKTCFYLDEEAASSSTLAIDTRHLSWSCQMLEQDLLKNIKKPEGLRTLLPLGSSHTYNGPVLPFPISLFMTLKQVRVLSFKHTGVDELPKSISKLKLLRYLDISYTNIRRLPKAVCTLHNLRILKFKNSQICRLPKKFTMLIKLQYIDWDFDTIKRLSLSSVGKLTCLQRLPLFEVGEKKGHSIIELRDMVYLQGSIRITRLEIIKDKEEAANAKLSSKKSLEKIELEWTNSHLNFDISEDVLSALRPHESLRKFQITNYGGQEFPPWLGELHLLECVQVRECKSWKFLPLLGHLPALKILCIEDMDHTESLGDTFHKLLSSSSYGRWFPVLESLQLINLPNLTSFPFLEQLISLKELEILDCAKLHDLSKVPPGVNIMWDGHHVAHDSMIDRIPTAGKDGQLKPTLNDPSIEVVGKSIESIEEPSVNTCSQVLADLSLYEFKGYKEMMRHCLLFPKDYKFAKKRLIHLWSAAGFLENTPFEDEGDRFFEIIFKNGFIIDRTNKDLSGTEIYQFDVMKIRSFLDELREVERSGKWEFKHFEEKIENANLNVNSFADYRDVSVTFGEIDQKSFESFKKFPKLRSLLFLNGSVTSVPSHIFSALNFLTTLDLSCTGIKELPTSVRYAKELRYLDLSWTLIERLPDSIADLFELQSLKLEGCTHLFSLPKKMKQLTKLRHLDFDVLGQLTSMPEGIGALVELQTLWAFIVGSIDGYSIKELKYMDHLSGKLCLSGLENVTKVEDAREAALIYKQHLSQLEFRWSSISKKIKKCNNVQVFEELKPPKYLKQLRIICFPVSKFPKWVGDRSYSNLSSIMLYKCEHCKRLPSLGELPNLEKLEIIDMNGVTKIDDSFSRKKENDERKPFPQLKTLTIDGMESLKEWNGLNGVNFPSLANLIIKQCPKFSTVKLSLPPSEIGQLSASLPCSHVEIVNCPKLARFPDNLLSSSLETLIIEDCPLGHRYLEGGKDRGKINRDAKVWIFQDTPTSDEDIPYSVLNTNPNLEETGTPQTINE